jgi:signal transduction histidine kinase
MNHLAETFSVDRPLSDANADDYDALMLPGVTDAGSLQTVRGVTDGDTARRRAAARRQAIEAADAERARLARDLHDGAQQRLVNTVITLKLTQQALQRGDDAAAALISEALEHAQQANTELRELAHGAMPAVLTHGGLRAGVEALAARVSLPVTIDVSVGRLARPIEAHAYFIVAEALTNVVKHARASAAEVRATVSGDVLRLEVLDDGIGGARVEGSTGLLGLDDRVRSLHGSLRVTSPAGCGTLIAADLPLPSSEPPPGDRGVDG